MSAPIERLLDGLEWIPVEPPQSGGDSDLPFVTHSGKFSFEGCEFRVYQLNTGERIVDGEDVAEFLGTIEREATA